LSWLEEKIAAVTLLPTNHGEVRADEASAAGSSTIKFEKSECPTGSAADQGHCRRLRFKQHSSAPDDVSKVALDVPGDLHDA
jgi:hypothetical protein